MTLEFFKFHGAGNDFILADNRNGTFSMDQQGIAALCDRHTGIGADGLMLLEEDRGADFRMLYFNSDGLPGTMCGNGGRCLVAFAHLLGIIKESTRFIASDGIHQARILQAGPPQWDVALEMSDANPPEETAEGYQVDTGSPHLVIFVPDVEGIDVAGRGRQIRFSSAYAPQGTNVNFVQKLDDHTLRIRTYERGVENETLACGTGAVAAALAATEKGIISASGHCLLKASGGDLQVSFSRDPQPDKPIGNIILRGPARMVFSGKMKL